MVRIDVHSTDKVIRKENVVEYHFRIDIKNYEVLIVAFHKVPEKRGVKHGNFLNVINCSFKKTCD